jgi:hypothetical protein
MLMEPILTELEELLEGTNYTVFLRVYRVPYAPHAQPDWYVTQALGPEAVLSGAPPVSRDEILTEVEKSLRYAGYQGSGPKQSVLRSSRFNELVLGVLSELKLLIAGANVLAEFGLYEGHPAYPVFWDFGYVIAGEAGGLVFIGSSSD